MLDFPRGLAPRGLLEIAGMLETEFDREALNDVGDDVAVVGAYRIKGRYDEPNNEDLLIAGQAPTFHAYRKSLSFAGITIGVTIDHIETQWGEIRGPFSVIAWRPEDDGAFVQLGLQQL